jgi:uncharacterized membrane protein YjjP (DUF1212 family)
VFDWLRKGLSRRREIDTTTERRMRINEEELQEEPPDRFVLIIQLMIIFFAGLLALEVVHMIFMGSWNDVIFNGIMLVVGTIVGAIWGRQNT